MKPIPLSQFFKNRSCTTLGDLSPGESGVVQKLNMPNRAKRKLEEMGLTPGVTVYVNGTAPFGDPIVISLRGYKLALRREDAAKILLR